MFKYTRHSLKKLETLFEEIDFTIRYEKGSFTSGYAIVEDRNIIVINKFYDVEGRINVLLDILGQTEVPLEALGEKSLKLHKQLEKNELIADEEEE
ncbi:MAG: hypothetical protein ACE362_17090 [Phaeodactylibacter xiamenensis]|uniref:Uncharacterized protein n=1 Tax=Phaeodactylibacter xiamenensis TaxID=1524460 RepID=A0A098S715_9BACT|nr:hypothetical protein [Phaeodactylibacter xiamenensis]KGE88354.1 hypothetical protein IX84_09155 [Phaeodactylibacter xiamenensis]MCR9052293.1 hypothetical protein [bacterium]